MLRTIAGGLLFGGISQLKFKKCYSEQNDPKPHQLISGKEFKQTRKNGIV